MDKMESNETTAISCDSNRPTKFVSPNFVVELLQTSYLEDPSAYFECRVCKKSFYNATALQNHKKLHHDTDANCRDKKSINDEVFDDGTDFKFIPLKTPTTNVTTTENGITKCTFNVDTSYIIVKVDSDDYAINTKRTRLDGVLRRTQMRAKAPVDIRGPFKCTLPSLYHPNLPCHQIFFNCCEYSIHYRDKHTKRRKAALRCQVCEKPLDHQAQFYNVALPCRFCDQIFFDRARYDEHNRLMHSKMKPHQCSICAKRFTQQGGLQQHMRMHTGIRPFVCSFCNKAFTQKAGLDQHLRTHTKVKPFKCVICSKCFSQSVHLRQHMRTHTNIQPFECPICGRRFKQSSHLNFHMRSHGESANGLIMEQYTRAVNERDTMDFLNLANVQPVQDGETIYYAAELSSLPAAYQRPNGPQSYVF